MKNFSAPCGSTITLNNGTKNYTFDLVINSLDQIAGKTKTMPKSFYDFKKFNISKNFINYCLPLIGKNIPQTSSIY